ncbi:N-acetylglucosamine-6-phosphate deacetylase [Actinomadura citrea]|jgi:N-acetylglucosamine-6-phosphate deacetylase|uniref:N-acetylglucosamine-6-phosphate deacetylase n=1 Tax=Actinomadura citrea TaxID=46158 RepID=A0A7Y9KBE7_9ACTN|nr:N-acetylglucosamine-6-phosphate deacetylase [Actinomadura citrea]NYE11166.1 N-acetylglucosamine-6-phosphate deacetylase [Actinomadura citrea]GGT78145.1 N-acetylglucosamine-6-phosphate deacetylase [Actinomadura citrea]
MAKPDDEGAVSLTNARIVLPDGVRDGALHIAGGTIAAAPGPGSGEVIDLAGRHVVPGFVDMHVHGGAGASYQLGRPDEAHRAASFHLAHGTTTTMASLVTGDPEELAGAVEGLADLAADGVIAGVHLEGPYLAPSRCGAHDPALLRDPDPAEFRRIVRLGRGHVRMITLAPELPGALDLVREAVDAGVIAAVGHTDGTGRSARAAFDAGARVATHLFNAMRPLHHREGGPVAAALNDPRVTVELINDGVHVDPAVARLVFAATPRVALITDAMAAAGMGDGDYRLGVMDVEVRDGRAVLAGGTSIAGSTITMADAFRRAVADLGLPVERAAEAASLTPARALGIDARVGSLEPGKDADLVVLDDDLRVDWVMKRGRRL